MLRVIARGLVMWDAITVDTATIDDSCPPFIRQQMARRGGSDVPEAILSAYYHIMAGQCFLLGLRYAGSAETTAVDSIERYMLQFETEHQRISRTVGNATQRRGLQTCLCAAILAQSLILAGTGDVNLLRRIRKVFSFQTFFIETENKKRTCSTTTTPAKTSAWQFTWPWGSCFSAAARPVSVGPPHPLSFFFFIYMSQNAETDNLSIALLVVSLYPRFPTSMTDNQYHLQALRHMHVLAVENRCLVTVDAVNQDYANVKVQVNLVDDQSISKSSGETHFSKLPNLFFFFKKKIRHHCRVAVFASRAIYHRVYQHRGQPVLAPDDLCAVTALGTDRASHVCTHVARARQGIRHAARGGSAAFSL